MNANKLLKTFILRQKRKILVGILATAMVGLTELFTGSLFKFLTNTITRFPQADSGETISKLPLKLNIDLPLLDHKIKIINTTLKGSNEILHGLLVIALVFFTLYFFQTLFLYIREVYMNSAVQRILQDFKNTIYRRLLKLPYSYFNRNQTGDIVSRVTYDVTTLNDIINLLIEISRAGVYMLLFIPVMFFINWQLAIFTVLFFPLSFFIIHIITKRIKKVSKKITDNVGDYTAFLENRINQTRLIKSLGTEEQEKQVFANLVEENYQHNLKLIRLKYLLKPSNELFGILGVTFVFIFFANQLVKGSSNIGDVAFFLYLVKTSYKPFKKVAQALGDLHVALVSTNKIARLFNELPEEPKLPKSEGKISEVHSVEFRKVIFGYTEDNTILNELNLNMVKGEIIGITGDTGVGKTTLANLLMGFFRPRSGYIMINHKDYRGMPLKQLRKIVGLVSNNTDVLPGTLRDNLLYGTRASDSDIMQYAEFLGIQSPTELDEKIGTGGKKISSGTRQKIALVRAFLRKPSIMIIDEGITNIEKEAYDYVMLQLKQFDMALIITRSQQILSITDCNYKLINGRLEKL